MITSFTTTTQPTTLTIGAGGIAAITAAGAVVSQGANAYSTGRMNLKNRKFAEHMYERQLTDNQANWHMQNEYNSPVKQMERLKAAGLNPNLVYGNGADVTSGSVQGASPQTPDTEAPQFENPTPAALNAYMGAQLQKQQLKNLQATEELIREQAYSQELKNNAEEYMQEDHGDGMTLRNAQNLSKYQEASSKAESSAAATRSALVKAEVDEATKESSIQAAALRILQMRLQNAKTEEEKNKINEQIKGIRSDNRLKELDVEFAENLNRRWDGYILKILGMILSGKK